MTNNEQLDTALKWALENLPRSDNALKILNTNSEYPRSLNAMKLFKIKNFYFDVNKIAWFEVIEKDGKFNIEIGFSSGGCKTLDSLDASFLQIFLVAMEKNADIEIISILEI